MRIGACRQWANMSIEEALRKLGSRIILKWEEECGLHRRTHRLEQRELHLCEIVKSVIEEVCE